MKIQDLRAIVRAVNEKYKIFYKIVNGIGYGVKIFLPICSLHPLK